MTHVNNSTNKNYVSEIVLIFFLTKIKGYSFIQIDRLHQIQTLLKT